MRQGHVRPDLFPQVVSIKLSPFPRLSIAVSCSSALVHEDPCVMSVFCTCMSSSHLLTLRICFLSVSEPVHYYVLFVFQLHRL